MKNNIYILLFLFIALFVTSCYDDKGNYNYTDLNDVQLSKIEESYTRTAFQDTLRINPEIHAENADAFTYRWTIRAQKSGNTDTAAVIGTRKVLDFPVNLRQGIYDILLFVTDDRKLERTFQTQLHVETQFSRGFYVLKEVENHGELDLHLPDQSVVPNLIEKSTGRLLEGKVHTLGFKFDYCYLNPVTLKYDFVNVLTLCSEKEALILKVEDLSIVYDHHTMFYGAVPADEPFYIYCHPYGIGYISNQGHYHTYQPPATESNRRGSGKFGLPYAIEGNCQPDMHLVICGNSYSSFFFDKLNQRLLVCDMDGWLDIFDEAGPYGITASPNNIPHQLQYFGKNDVGYSSYGYAVFKDGLSGKHYIYEIDMNLVLNYDFSNPIMKVTEVPAGFKFNTAHDFAINEKNTKTMWFVAENRLYLYDIEQNTEMPLSPAGLPDDEEITYLSNRFWTQEDDAGNTFNYLAIGTYKDGNYKVYLYNTLGGEPQGGPQQILKGKGKVVMMQYMSPKMVQDSFMEYPGAQ